MLGDLDKLATYAFIGALLTFSLGNSIHAVEPPRTEPVPATKESSDWGAGKWQAEYKLKVREPISKRSNSGKQHGLILLWSRSWPPR